MTRQLAFQIFLALFLLFSMVVATALGRFSIPLETVFHVLWKGVIDPDVVKESVEYRVIFQVRLPRILLAALTGVALSVSGAVLQGIFRNPLVGPGIIGVASGAAFGAVTAILIAASSVLIMTLSFAGGMAALFITLSIAGKVGLKNILAIILGGIVTGAFFSALVSIVTYIADPRDTLPLIVYWLMGSFSSADTDKLLLLGLISLACFAVLFKSRYVINLLALGDEEAYALGVPVTRLRMLFLAITTLMTAAAVSVSGTIGWVGLVVPHIARLITGSDYRSLVTSSALLGALYLLVADTLVRTTPYGEIPIGILSALVGAPVLAYLLRSRTISS